MKWLIILFCFMSGTSLAQKKVLRPAELFEQGVAAFNAGRLVQALEFFDQCLKQAPGYLPAYPSRATVREQLGDLQGALTDYSVYLEHRPDEYDPLFTRATIRYQLGLYEQAREDYIRLLKLSPQGETTTVYFERSPSAMSGGNKVMTAQSMSKPLLFNYIGMAETKLKNYPQAIRWLDSAIMLQSKEPTYYVNRGLAKKALGDSTATKDFLSALKLDPGHTAALSNLSVEHRGKAEKSSVDYVEEAIESDSTMLYPYLERAFQRMEGGFWQGAEEDYSRALEIEKNDPEIWMNRAIAREKQNKLDQAYEDYTQSLRLKEDNFKAWLNRGNILNKQGQHAAAIDDYTVALTFNPEFSAAYYNRAIARERLKKYDQACEDLKHAERLGREVEPKLKDKVCE